MNRTPGTDKVTFCTFFDHRYLQRGLALYESLASHAPEFELWVLCMDDETHECLSRENAARMRLIRLGDLARADQRLWESKKTRSLVEFYFTAKASLCLYVFDNCPDATHVTYADADLFFFANPKALYDEMGRASIAISPHRFPPESHHMLRFGRYNAGWLTFKRDADGLACLQWWRERCLEWCHDVVESDRYADQKYINRFAAQFAGVHVIDHAGANVAPWNLAGHRVTLNDGSVFVDGKPLIFYHFHGLKRVWGPIHDTGLAIEGLKASAVIRERIYRPYLAALARKPACGGHRKGALARNAQSGDRRSGPWEWARRGVAMMERAKKFAKGVYMRTYIMGAGLK